MIATLHITPLRIANIPPPMSLWQLTLEEIAVDTAINMSGNHLAVLSNKSLCLYSLDVTKQPLSAPKVLWRSNPLAFENPRRVVFIGDAQVFVLADYWDDDTCGLWSSENNEWIYKGRVGKRGVSISDLVTDLDYKDLFLQFHNGALHQLETKGDSPQDMPSSNCGTLVNKFPSLAAEVRVVVGQNNKVRQETRCSAPATWTDIPQALCFGLTKSGILYANERVLLHNCTSFTVTPAHLILTTTQHYLKFVHLADVNGKLAPQLWSVFFLIKSRAGDTS